jgi:hypothetical protein
LVVDHAIDRYKVRLAPDSDPIVDTAEGPSRSTISVRPDRRKSRINSSSYVALIFSKSSAGPIGQNQFDVVRHRGHEPCFGRAIQNDNDHVPESGLFQGKLGFKLAIVLLEDGCEEFSNIRRLNQIRFPKGNIAAVF